MRASRRLRAPARVIAYLGGAVALGLAATGGSYALWADSADVTATTLSSGSTGLTINGATQHTLAGLDASKLAPGRSVVTASPVVLRNTGSTPLSAAVTGAAVTSDLNAMAAELTIRLTPASTCSPGLAGGASGRIAGFTTTSTPYSLAPGETIGVCLEVALDADAPEGVRNGAATFRLDFEATQVRR